MDASVWTGAAVALGVLAASTGVGLWRRRREGAVRPVAGRPAAAGDHGDLLARLGVEPGTPVTLVQFSSAFCAPCRATRQVCTQVAAKLDGVRHIEVDAESHLDAVRALDIWRTPTVLVVDAAGTVIRRVSGRPGRAQLVAAIAAVHPLTAGSRP